MTKEDIENAAIKNIEFQGKLDLGSIIENSCRESFVLGANWRINSIWHNAKEDPKEKEMLVVIDKYGDIIQSEFMIYEFLGREKWSDYAIDVGIVRWCYRKDLLPNKEDNI